MKTKLPNRTYYLRLVFLLMIGTSIINTQAQIIYTDIEPDFSSENIGDQYSLDLNNDFIVDFTLKSINYGYYDWFEIRTKSDAVNSIITVQPWYSNTMPLDYNTEIFILPSFSTNGEIYESWGIFTVGDCFGGETGCFYDWQDSNDKYLGLRFLINGQTHYGWARLDVTSHIQWVLKDYAYNATPNQPILAGQGVLGLEESILKEIKIIVSDGRVSIFNLTNRTKFNLYAINGQIILHGDLEKTNHTINVENLSSGLYIIELIAHNSASILKRKILIN